jgi:hypothetical protein
MIPVSFENQADFVKQIAEDLIGDHPSCWNVVLPPGFGEERFVSELEKRLRGCPHPPRLAVRGADHTNKTITAFVQALHEQWAELPDRPKPMHKDADVYLDRLLASLRGNHRPLILILKRFHKVLDNLDKWILGVLHEEEEARRLDTVTITPLPYEHLKKRWKAQPRLKYFSNSDYGGARHKLLVAKPATYMQAVELANSFGIPEWVADDAWRVTGGYPEPLGAALEWWDKARATNQARSSLQGEMLRQSSKQLAGFVEWLDPLEDGKYRDFVIDLYHNVNTEHAVDAFQYHPWRDLVLDEEQSLRAEAVGAAALNAALGDNADKKTSRSSWYDIKERARRLYERRQFDTALQVLHSIDPIRLRPHDRVLQSHTLVMLELVRDGKVEQFSADTDCRRLLRALREARETLATPGLSPSEVEKQKILNRYDRLENTAAAIQRASGVTGRFENRLVDILAGFADRDHENVQAALLLLLARIEAGKAIAGHCSACQFVSALPEQIFCTWALWALRLNYYQAPEVDDATWQTVEAKWPRVRGTVQRAKPGMQFPSFYVFTFYALARWHSQSSAKNISAPENGFKELQSALSNWERVRTGNAHGMYQASKRQREVYFDIIERWFESLLSSCPNSVTREDLLEMTEPLPVINADGAVVWSPSA